MPAVVIRPPDLWYRTAQELREFEPALLRGLRRELKSIGEEGAEHVRKTLRLPPPTNGDESRGSRSELAGNTKVMVSFTKRSAGAKIRTTGGDLGSFALGYNSKSFRHRVFGQDTWVQQEGRPYFGVSIEKVFTEQMAARMGEAIDTANAAIGARGN